MSWILLLSIAFLLAAIVIIEMRAVRTGDERSHHGPGYALVMGGLVLMGLGIAAAISDQAAIALASSSAGLIAVAVGGTRHHDTTAPRPHGPR